MLREIERFSALHVFVSISIPAGGIAKVDTYAAHAFVCQCSVDRLALVDDGRCTTTEGIPIGLRTHHIYEVVLLAETLSILGIIRKGKEGAHREQAQRNPRRLYHWTSHKHPCPLRSR